MRTAILGAALIVIGAVAIAVGILPVPEASALGERVWPILLFVVAITVVTELAAEAGLFRVIAEQTARWGRGRAWLLWLLVLVLAVLSTIFLSLDTTAVLLTPVVVVLARHVGLSPLPFALTTVWIANTASLLLPVSNLTNLLAEHEMGSLGPLGFAGLMALPALIAIVVPAVILFIVSRKSLLQRYTAEQRSEPDDRLVLVASAIVVVALLPLLVSGLPVWMPALAAAIVLGIVFLVRRREVLRLSLIPWQLVVFATGLFLVVEAAHSLGLTSLLASVSGSGSDLLSLLRLAGTGALGANVLDNLPAYLALEPVAGSPVRLAALLIGVNAGPLITPWASLATLLWHQRLTALGVEISWHRYIMLGAIAAPLTVASATVGLWLSA
ncbi:SLC13 family permease [Lacisediminihabitans changchengi]|uniref:Arsenic transporter n=1 Tax=Lacisediminihabitans changchengi TaxID=2787634 RepID=A0A934SQM0_9MICO|nr:SLC13 family permease [Lacisediminihabitans changchengi]MBK4346379.1 arsenic transporter [Lacisediminihabitans changchengi]